MNYKAATVSSDSIEVHGDYSQKIVSIIQNVLKLKEQEKDVKIILFSHWDNILDIIAKALKQNNIVFRTKNHKFERCIDEFKVTISIQILGW